MPSSRRRSRGYLKRAVILLCCSAAGMIITIFWAYYLTENGLLIVAGAFIMVTLVWGLVELSKWYRWRPKF